MASRGVCPKVLNNFYGLRRLNSAAPSTTSAVHRRNFSDKPNSFPPKPTATAAPHLNFSDKPDIFHKRPNITTVDAAFSLDESKKKYSSISTPKLIKSTTPDTFLPKPTTAGAGVQQANFSDKPNTFPPKPPTSAASIPQLNLTDNPNTFPPKPPTTPTDPGFSHVPKEQYSSLSTPELIDPTIRDTFPAKPATPSAEPQLKFSDKSDSSAPKPASTVDDSTIINLDDSKKLFASVSTPKLIKSSLTLHVAAIEPMVDFGMWVMNSRIMENPVSRQIVLDVTEHSFYEHFCPGKDLKEAGMTVNKLSDAGLNAMLDYGMEHAHDNASCDQNCEDFIVTIESTQSENTSPVSYVVVKITAICPPKLLERVSDLLRWEYKDNSMHLPWKLQSLQIFSNSSPLYHTPTRPEPLTPDEERDLHLAYHRLTKICKKSLEANVQLLIDAEDTSIQPAIDYFTYSAAIAYHRDDSALIFNTIQAYLKDAKERLVIAKKEADKIGVPMGFKLVRGAYMSSERRLATRLGTNSPIHDGIENTHACYNECAAFMLDQIAQGTGSVVLATHNIESGKLAATKAVDLGIEKDSQNLQFAQLYGMAEALSFGLRNAGFRVSKYLPFGPVDQIMPYLLRRAEENRGLLSTSSVDRKLMRKELFRRLTSTS